MVVFANEYIDSLVAVILCLDTSGGCKFEKCCSVTGVLTLGLGKTGAGFVCEELETGNSLELFFLNGIGICFL